MVAEFFRITAGEEHLVHVYEFGRCQSPVRTILLQKKKVNIKLISLYIALKKMNEYSLGMTKIEVGDGSWWKILQNLKKGGY